MTDIRKLLLCIGCVFVLGAGSSHAQSEGDWIGLASGYPLLPTVYYGLDDALGSRVDLRLNAGIRRFNYSVGSGVAGTVLSVGADALLQLPVTPEQLKVYAGGGVALAGGSGRQGDAYGFSVNVSARGLAGLEYRLDAWGLVAELNAGLDSYFSPDSFTRFAPALRLGVNYHF